MNGLSQLSDTDQVGLWTFPSEAGVYRQQLPLAPLGPERQLMTTRIEQLIPSGGTPLYAVTRPRWTPFEPEPGTTPSTPWW